ncbi:MAG TPA: uroporphyrinogen decarboxylase family protein [Acidobacteriota bacterium]|nr:uroporphyrinogen decarboxylase family protein [Acidobacteriota bacterium]
MNSKKRLELAMNSKEADRVPLMCQLSMGHYFLHSGFDPVEVWCTSERFAEALVRLQERYQFDGILVNLPGRSENWEKHVRKTERQSSFTRIEWDKGGNTVFPFDDNPRFKGSTPGATVTFEALRPEDLYYVEPWGLSGLNYPYAWDFDEGCIGFPPYQQDTLKQVIRQVDGSVSVHAEVFSPWSQFLELLGYENGLMGIMDDAAKVKECLNRLVVGASDLGYLHAREGVDAILISSAFAGGGFISREHYREFVLPCERSLVEELRKHFTGPVYTHTCGSIGDRLDLMLMTGTDGIDTLDPPPLGTVDLEEAKTILQGKAFIKGNIDPVNTLLNGSRDDVKRDARYRLTVGKPGGGYILSTACSVAPKTPPENIEALYESVSAYGSY